MTPELRLRIISALVLLAICLPLIWFGGVPFLAMCIVLSGLLIYELLRILQSGAAMAGTKYPFWLSGGVLYALIPVICLPLIRETVTPSGLFLLLLLFLSVWVTDVAAYFCGRHFGGPKLLPKVSPKKTWSGALGGLFGAMVAGSMLALFVDGFSPLWCVLGAGVLSVFSQAGDLLESWGKRRFDVKDSSNLIPGHGGFLDRVDGLLVAAVPMTLYVLLTVN